MPHIEIERQHTLTQAEMTEKINHLVVKLKQRLSVRGEWESANCLNFSRKGVKGNITLSEGKLHIAIHLGLMYRALRSSIEQEINSALDSYLA